MVGGQSLIVDRVSEKIGVWGRPFGGKAGEVAVQYIVSAAISEYAVPTTTYWVFNAFNLGVPNDVRPMH
jgi:hypothetical protein